MPARDDPLAGTGRLHGTYSGSALCDCDVCRQAARSYWTARRRALGVRPAAETQRPQHGTRARYRKGCREECCRSVEREYRRRYRGERRSA